MSQIQEIIVPNKIYEGETFKIQVKAISEISWQQLKDNFTWETLTNYKFQDIGGNN